MVFVDKSLDQMLQEIGPIKEIDGLYVEREDEPSGCLLFGYKRKKDVNCFLNYLDKNRQLLKSRLDSVDALALLEDPSYPGRMRLGIVDFLVENGLYHAYQVVGTVSVSYTFGEKGLLVVVSDKGTGFDPAPVVEAAQAGKLEKGVHFKGNGWAFKAMARPEFEVSIQSDKLKGTAVNVLYKYKSINSPYLR